MFATELTLLALVCLCCALLVALVTPRLQIAPPLSRLLTVIALAGVLVANVTLVYAVGIF